MSAGDNRKVILLNAGGKGGLAHYSYCLASALQEAGYCVKLITEREYELRSLNHSFEVVLLPLRRAIGFLYLIRELFQNRNHAVVFQITNSHCFLELLVTIVARLSNRAVHLTVHNVNPHDDSKRRPALMKWKYLIANGIIVLNEQQLEELTSEYPSCARNARVVYHGDYRFLRLGSSGPSVPRPITGRPWNILFFGAIAPNKGLDVLLQAFRLLLDAKRCAFLHVIGKMREDAAVYAMTVRELRLCDHVRIRDEFVDHQQIAQIFCDADVVCLPYRRATESGVAHVALAFGKPIVATRTGGLIEMHQRGLIAKLAEPNNPRDLSQKIGELMDEVVSGSYKAPPADYPWEKVVEGYSHFLNPTGWGTEQHMRLPGHEQSVSFRP